MKTSTKALCADLLQRHHVGAPLAHRSELAGQHRAITAVHVPRGQAHFRAPRTHCGSWPTTGSWQTRSEHRGFEAKESRPLDPEAPAQRLARLASPRAGDCCHRPGTERLATAPADEPTEAALRDCSAPCRSRFSRCARVRLRPLGRVRNETASRSAPILRARPRGQRAAR